MIDVYVLLLESDKAVFHHFASLASSSRLDKLDSLLDTILLQVDMVSINLTAVILNY